MAPRSDDGSSRVLCHCCSRPWVALPPVIILACAALGWASWPSAAVAAAVSAAAAVLALRLMLKPEIRRLRLGLEHQAKASPWAPLLEGEGRWVAFAPTDRPMLFDGTASWDYGWLVPGDRGVAFFGERVQCLWPWQRIAAIGLGPSAPDWWRPPAVYLSSRDESGARFTVHFLAAQPGLFPRSQLADTLLAAIELRRDGSGPALDAYELEPWQPTRTTGATSWSVYRHPRQLLSGALLFVLTSLIVAALLRVDLVPAVVASFVSYLALNLPVYLYRERPFVAPAATSPTTSDG